MSWFRRLVASVRQWFSPRLIALHVEELPDLLAVRRIYLVGEDDPWQAAFQCPCGCEALIQLSLIPEDKPSWNASVHDDGTVTLFPSIWRKRNCKAHFFVRQGKVVWTRDSGQPGQQG